jgi:hypothetical protein
MRVVRMKSSDARRRENAKACQREGMSARRHVSEESSLPSSSRTSELLATPTGRANDDRLRVVQ